MHEQKKKTLFYYLDEVSVFLFCIIGVALSNTIEKITEGSIETFFVSWPQILASSIVAIIVYGSMYQSWKKIDSKPAWIKRISNALFHGIAWKTILNLTSNS
jgi:hypothetical protein